MSRILHSAYFLLSLSGTLYVKGASPDIRLDETFPNPVRMDLDIVAKDVAMVVSEIFGSTQPPLLAPIVCSLGPPPPRTSLDDWFKPRQIRINLTVRDRGYAQFAFQLGHELGHVMIGVYRSNQAFETIATAVSLEVLDRLTTEWQAQSRYPSWANYAMAFRKYREDREVGALDRLGLKEVWQARGLESIKRRIRLDNQTIDIKAGGVSSDLGRELQIVGAMVMRLEFSPWLGVVGLEACTSPSPELNHNFMILPPLRTCVQQRAPVVSWLVPGSQLTSSPETQQKCK
jgi:hypothetical protein